MTSELTHAGSLDTAEQTGEPAPVSEPPAPPPRRLGRRCVRARAAPPRLRGHRHHPRDLLSDRGRDQRRHDPQRHCQRRLHRPSQLVARRRAGDVRECDSRRVHVASQPAVVRHHVVRVASRCVGGDRRGRVHLAAQASDRGAHRRSIATMLVLTPWMILRVSFTSTALLVGAAGIMVFAASREGARPDRHDVRSGRRRFARDLVPDPRLLVPRHRHCVRSGARDRRLQGRDPAQRRFTLTIGIFILVGFGTNRLQYGRSAEWHTS